MIVGPLFEGDKRNEVMMLQHNFYFENLPKLVFKSQSRYIEAVKLLQSDFNIPLTSLTFTSFDHRKFQLYHDIIAAYFRFKNYSQLEQTLFESNQENLDRIKNDWLKFWDDEIEILTQNNDWVRAIILIAISSNKDIIERAQNALLNILKHRYYEFKECSYFNLA